MCVAFFAINSVPGYHLILAANRDEFYARPSEPLHNWPGTDLYAGKDIEKGGTWLGCTQKGRWSLITNFRDPSEFSRQAKSRGNLVSNFLASKTDPLTYTRQVATDMDAYNGFNLIVSDHQTTCYLSNRKNEPEIITAGFYGLSNGLLDSAWPKQMEGTKAFKAQIEKDTESIDGYFNFLSNKNTAADEDLPKTGIKLEHERLLSSLFITSPEYGTKSSSLLLIKESGQIHMVERSWNVYKDIEQPKYSDVVIKVQITR